MADIIYPKSGFGRAGESGPSTREVGRVDGLAKTNPHIPIPLCCPRVSGSPQTRTDSVRTLLVSLIHNSQFRCTEQNGTDPPAKSRSSSRSCRYKSACFLRWGVAVGSAVIGSGAHVTVVAPVDNACGICKAFMK